MNKLKIYYLLNLDNEGGNIMDNFNDKQGEELVVMNENTIMEVTYLISKDSYTLKGKSQIEEDLIDNLETLYMYADIQTEKELNDLINLIPTNFNYVMNYVCDLMELDYNYLEN